MTNKTRNYTLPYSNVMTKTKSKQIIENNTLVFNTITILQLSFRKKREYVNVIH